MASSQVTARLKSKMIQAKAEIKKIVNEFVLYIPMMEQSITFCDKNGNEVTLYGKVAFGSSFEDAMKQILEQNGARYGIKYYESIHMSGVDWIQICIAQNGLDAVVLELHNIQGYVDGGMACQTVQDKIKQDQNLKWLNLQETPVPKDGSKQLVIKDDSGMISELPNNTKDLAKIKPLDGKCVPCAGSSTVPDADGKSGDIMICNMGNGELSPYAQSKEETQFKENELKLQDLKMAPTYLDAGDNFRPTCSLNLQPSFCIANMDTSAHEEFHFVPIESPNSALQNTINVTVNVPQSVIEGDAGKKHSDHVGKTSKPSKTYVVYPYTYEDILASPQLRKMYGHLIGLVDTEGQISARQNGKPKETNRNEGTAKKNEKRQKQTSAKKAEIIVPNERQGAKILPFPNMNSSKKEPDKKAEAAKKEKEDTVEEMKKKKQTTIVAGTKGQVIKYTTKERVIERLREMQNKQILERKEILRNALNKLLEKLKGAKTDMERQNLQRRIDGIKWALLRLKRRLPEPKLKKEPTEIEKKEEKKKAVVGKAVAKKPTIKTPKIVKQKPEKQQKAKATEIKRETKAEKKKSGRIQQKAEQQKVEQQQVKKAVKAQRIKVAKEKKAQIKKKAKKQKITRDEGLKRAKKHGPTVQLVKESQAEKVPDKIAEIKKKLRENLEDTEFGSPFEANNLSYVLGAIESNPKKKRAK
ncbi:MAG: hypothetical protein ABII22_06120 [Candidatus Micrarchaeota archaeon]